MMCFFFLFACLFPYLEKQCSFISVGWEGNLWMMILQNSNQTPRNVSSLSTWKTLQALDVKMNHMSSHWQNCTKYIWFFSVVGFLLLHIYTWAMFGYLITALIEKQKLFVYLLSFWSQCMHRLWFGFSVFPLKLILAIPFA